MAKRGAKGQPRKKNAPKKKANAAGGAGTCAPGGVFVIQKHAATQLHYDLRLEAEGTMKSWAVPKGPSLSTRQKRLAMMVEDHALEYNDFEGVIPEGYGAGTVMVWDRGTYEVLPDDKNGEPPAPAAALAAGFMRFRLAGQKLRGAWKIFKFRGKNNWLLCKSSDEFVDHERNVLEEKPDSAKTGRTMDQIAESGELYEGECS